LLDARIPTLGNQELRAAPVIEHQRHLVEFEALEGLDEQANLTLEREGPPRHASLCGARPSASSVGRSESQVEAVRRVIPQEPVISSPCKRTITGAASQLSSWSKTPGVSSISGTQAPHGYDSSLPGY
jgi:hypothetical protein